MTSQPTTPLSGYSIFPTVERFPSARNPSGADTSVSAGWLPVSDGRPGTGYRRFHESPDKAAK